MIKNYLLTGFRNLRKRLSYSLINIFGLGLGLATCLLLVIWLKHEVSYDTFHLDADRIYRSTLEMSFGGQVHQSPQSPNKLVEVIQQHFPEVEHGVRLYNITTYGPYTIQYEEKIFQESHFSFTDSSFFEVFSFPLLKGNPQKALTQPFTLVLTEAMTEKYFGREDPIGKTIRVNNQHDYTITGVMANIPSNSSIQVDFLASFVSNHYGKGETQWFPANFLTFIKVSDKANLGIIAEKVNTVVKTELAAELSGDNDYVRFGFIPMSDIHLKEQGNLQYIYIFAAIAVLILLIACSNYINLATARAADRAKEVGVRKVVGAGFRQLFGQFMGESIFITLLAFFTALLMAQALLPLFNTLTGKNFEGSIFFEPTFLFITLIIILSVALLAGAYPALAVTSFKPVHILKGNFNFTGKGIGLRKFLVVTQFTISIALIISALVISKQLRYMQQKNLGFDKENTLILPLDQNITAVYPQLKTELLRSQRVAFVARASESPTAIRGGYGLSYPGAQKHDMLVTGLTADADFLPALKLELKVGRNFTEADFQKVQADTTHQSSSFIFNETVLHELSIDADEAIGTHINFNGREGDIIGVVKDFHFASMHKPIGPLVIFNEVEQFNYIFIRLNPGNLTESIAEIKKIYATLAPHKPFEFEFVDQQYASMYAAEQRMGSIFTVFASLAIIIACLGLLGLVSFAATQKTKEIGIRKVLGATPSNIVMLISNDFIRLVLIAILVGLPLTYIFMTKWLSNFAYKSEIGSGPLVVASILCLMIAFGTAGFQAVKAALIDPVKTLRND